LGSEDYARLLEELKFRQIKHRIADRRLVIKGDARMQKTSLREPKEMDTSRIVFSDRIISKMGEGGNPVSPP
jgi:hypothetical protein